MARLSAAACACATCVFIDSATTIAIVPPREGEPTGVQTRVAYGTDDIDADAYNDDEGNESLWTPCHQIGIV